MWGSFRTVKPMDAGSCSSIRNGRSWRNIPCRVPTKKSWRQPSSTVADGSFIANRSITPKRSRKRWRAWPCPTTVCGHRVSFTIRYRTRSCNQRNGRRPWSATASWMSIGRAEVSLRATRRLCSANGKKTEVWNWRITAIAQSMIT